jgi:hypothetical protein
LPSGFPITIFYAFLILSIRATNPTHVILHDPINLILSSEAPHSADFSRPCCETFREMLVFTGSR